MSIKIYNGHLVYFIGKWIKTDIGDEIVKADDAHEGKTYQFNNIVAKSPEQLSFLLSTEIQKLEKTRKPIFIEKDYITYTVSAEVPSYSERLMEIGG